jgi:hypothetical protein
MMRITGPRLEWVTAPAVTSLRRSSHDVPVNTLNVNVSVRLIVDLYDSTVVPCNTPISTSVNESTGRL